MNCNLVRKRVMCMASSAASLSAFFPLGFAAGSNFIFSNKYGGDSAYNISLAEAYKGTAGAAALCGLYFGFNDGRQLYRFFDNFDSWLLGKGPLISFMQLMDPTPLGYAAIGALGSCFMEMNASKGAAAGATGWFILMGGIALSIMVLKVVIVIVCLLAAAFYGAKYLLEKLCFSVDSDSDTVQQQRQNDLRAVLITTQGEGTVDGDNNTPITINIIPSSEDLGTAVNQQAETEAGGATAAADENCAICFEEITADRPGANPLIFSNCNHSSYFHQECVTFWRDEGNRRAPIPCPLCRKDLNESEIPSARDTIQIE